MTKAVGLVSLNRVEIGQPLLRFFRWSLGWFLGFVRCWGNDCGLTFGREVTEGLHVWGSQRSGENLPGVVETHQESAFGREIHPIVLIV